MKLKRLARSLVWRLTPRKIRERKIALMLWQSIEREDKLRNLSNQELAEMLRETVLYELRLFTPMYDLIDEVIERLDPGWADRLAEASENRIDELLEDTGS